MNSIPTRRFRLLATCLLVSSAALLPACLPQAAETSPAKLGDPLPAFSLSRLDGATFSREGLAGKAVLLDFWATWCKPCHVQTDILETVLREGGVNAELYAVNSGEDRETVERFVGKEPFSYPVVLDPDDKLGVSLEVAALPTVVIVDKAGKISFISEGITGADVIRAELAKANAP